MRSSSKWITSEFLIKIMKTIRNKIKLKENRKNGIFSKQKNSDILVQLHKISFSNLRHQFVCLICKPTESTQIWKSIKGWKTMQGANKFGGKSNQKDQKCLK